MSDNYRCRDCGGSDGFHFNDCSYDGIDGGRPSYFKGGGNSTPGGWWVCYIIALFIGYGINELLGVIILLVLIFWLAVN